jgi:hypothetical protein
MNDTEGTKVFLVFFVHRFAQIFTDYFGGVGGNRMRAGELGNGVSLAEGVGLDWNGLMRVVWGRKVLGYGGS